MVSDSGAGGNLATRVVWIGLPRDRGPLRAARVRAPPLPPEHAESLRFDAQGDVELRAEVLEGRRGSQLDDLRFGEVRADACEQPVVYLAPGDRHRLRVLDRCLLAVAEKVAGQRLGDLGDLVLRRPRLHPTGCIDVDSEGAA